MNLRRNFPKDFNRRKNVNHQKSIQINNEYIPCDVKNLIPRDISENDFCHYNFSIIYRFPNIISDRGKIKVKINDNIDIFKWKQDWINEINQRYATAIENLQSHGFALQEFETLLFWRMVIGLGASHPQETSMTLHHIYGIPYIPGSAVKGVTRHWTIMDKFDNDEKKAEEDEDFKQIFGIQNHIGKVIFFDAYPIDEIKLKMDVMTPHYPDYYSKGVPPADWQQPVPIKFLTVENTKFKFCLASRDKNALSNAETWLKEALQNYGIGAKTAIGYGYFQE